MPSPDRDTLCAWFAAHGRGLVLFARQALPPEHRVAAEDVVQEVFVRLLVRATGDPAAGRFPGASDVCDLAVEGGRAGRLAVSVRPQRL
jgi:hypothetical protein